jgi:hypothetical protein
MAEIDIHVGLLPDVGSMALCIITAKMPQNFFGPSCQALWPYHRPNAGLYKEWFEDTYAWSPQ